MVRIFRMRRFNPKSLNGKFDYLFPQTITTNILRSEDGGVLESDLVRYDRHLGDKVKHLNRASSSGSARALSVSLKDVTLVDGFPLLLTLHTGLECEPTLSFNGGDPYPIVSARGEKIPGGQTEGSVIFIVWSEDDHNWQLMGGDNYSDVTKVVLPVESEYVYTATSDHETLITIPGFDKKSCKLSVNYEQTMLRHDIDYRFHAESNNAIELIDFALEKDEKLYFVITSYITTAKRGHFRYELKDTDYPVVIEEDGTTEVRLPTEALNAHAVVVNYEQTILRNNLDYVYNEWHNGIKLLNFALSKGDTIVFNVTEFVEAPGELVPNNWGATGNYRYSLNVIHGSYVATEDNVSIFPVPNFNSRRDDIALIDDNKLYIYDVDYTIDELGQIVLLKRKLNTGDEIFFTILQGAMMDVPNFNVIEDAGQEGQHLLLNMSYSVLCDYYTLLVRLKHDLLTAPTAKCVDGPAEPICDCFGNPVIGGYKKGSYLWLVYSEPAHMWYSLGHGQVDLSTLVPQNLVTSGVANFTGQQQNVGTNPPEFHETVIKHDLGIEPKRIDITPCEPPTVLADGTVTTIGDIWTYADTNNLYVGNTGLSTSKFKWTVSTEDVTNDLRGFLQSEINKFRNLPGKIITHLYVFTASEDHEVHISQIENYNARRGDKMIVNYNQTVLREGIDYDLTPLDDGITLKTFELDAGEIIQFTIFEQVKT